MQDITVLMYDGGMSAPTAEDYIRAHLRQMRAPLKRRTMFGPAGRLRSSSAGERKLLGPDGRPIKIITDEHGGTTVSTDEMQAVHVRADPVRLGTRT